MEVSFEKWLEKKSGLKQLEAIDIPLTQEEFDALLDWAEAAYLAATERKDERIAELEQEVERITDIIKSIPCAGCEIADGSHFSDCPKYTTEWIMFLFDKWKQSQSKP